MTVSISTVLRPLVKGALFVLVIAFGACYLMNARDSSKQEIIEAFTALDPNFSADNLLFDGCVFGFSIEHAGQNELMQMHQRIDLTHFNLQSVNLQNRADGKVRLNVSHIPGQHDLVTQASQVVDLTSPDPEDTGELTLYPNSGGQITFSPLQQHNDAKAQRQELARILRQENGQIVMRMIAEVDISETGEVQGLKKHPDAPGFYDFAQSVIQLPNPMSAQVSLHYVGKTATRENFRTGSVATPGALQLTFPDQSGAISFAQLLARHRKDGCAN
jgi:hypothetical protein